MPGALLGGVLIGLTEAMAGLFFTPSAKSMFAFAHPGAGAAVPAAGHPGQESRHDRARLLHGVPRRGLVLLAAAAGGLVAAPLFANDYLLTVLILILYFAYTGQAWNIMMGFAGQLSLGHALYVGLGAYAAAALYVHFGIGPWLGMPVAILIAVACGAIIGFLAFRFGVGGVYFAILTIAFAEFARIGFDHFDWVGGSAGLFLPVAQLHPQRSLEPARPAGDVLLRDPGADGRGLRRLPRAAAKPRRLLLAGDPRGRAGGALARHRHLPLQDDRGRDLGRHDGARPACSIAFYYNNLFPEQIFHISRSIEIILGPIIGGIGTLFGPVIGAFLLTGLVGGLAGTAHRASASTRRAPSACSTASACCWW